MLRNRAALALGALVLGGVVLLGLEPGASGTAAAADNKVIKIGALFPISGPGSFFGVQDKQGVELAIEQINKEGGVAGTKLEVHYEDSACAPLPASQAAKRL